MKRIISIILLVGLLAMGSLGSFATKNSYENNNSDKQHKAAMKIIDKYYQFYEDTNGDSELAIEELLKSNSSLKNVNHSNTIYDVSNGEAILLSVVENGEITYSNNDLITIKSTSANLSFTDDIVYDSDWDTYVYLGTWNWTNGHPDELLIQPWDMVGLFSQNGSEIHAQEYIVRGYNVSGIQQIYYNTDTNTVSGQISKGTDNYSGVAFWHNEYNVDHGALTAPLYWTSGSDAKVMMKYNHSWTSTTITGVGGQVSISGGGFSISWDTRAEHWQDIATSSGVSLP